MHRYQTSVIMVNFEIQVQRKLILKCNLKNQDK